MRSRLRPPLVAALLTLTACAGSSQGVVPPEEIVLRPTRTSFAPGEAMDLELWNRSRDAMGFNACSGLILERRLGGDAWDRVSHQPPGTACTLQLDALEPDRSTLVRIPPPDGLPPGVYRVRMHVEWPLGDGRVEVRSPPFSVGR
ncbi:MAG: hypothetical protein KY453_08565 [Gemmatimonadetes bacterium]|nr:hypothetical protein [Gemmatimonadota bacterium]